MVGMGRPVTVAIVDDDAIVRAALVAYLTSTEGFEVRHELTNGAEAVSVITRDPVDVVVMEEIVVTNTGMVIKKRNLSQHLFRMKL